MQRPPTSPRPRFSSPCSNAPAYGTGRHHSACYSGFFIRPLANADALPITAADADHSSFGCRDSAPWTYFGDAFFNTAIRRTANLRDALTLAQGLVRKRELRNGFPPSTLKSPGARISSRC
jgi:Peptidase C13 family